MKLGNDDDPVYAYGGVLETYGVKPDGRPAGGRQQEDPVLVIMMKRRRKIRETTYLTVDPQAPQPEVIAGAAAVIRSGGTVVFPTETVYGLGANGLDPAAVEGIYEAKGRPRRNPLILHVASAEQGRRLLSAWSPEAERLAGRFWPGPLTLILPRSSLVPDVVTAGLPNVALRMPSHPVALALIEECGLPVAAPSANTSGRPSPTLAEHVRADLDGMVDLVLDGGPTQVGVESTIVDLSGGRPLLLRPGGVTLEELEQVLGRVLVHETARPGAPVPHPGGAGCPPGPAPPPLETVAAGRPGGAGAAEGMRDDGLAVPCPGTMFRHYAPAAEAVVVTGSPGEQEGKVRSYLAAHPGRKVALLATAENAPLYLKMMGGRGRATPAGAPVHLEVLGCRSRPEEIAGRIFSALRNCDQAGAEVILMEAIPLQGMGLAVMNRLYRAAANRVI